MLSAEDVLNMTFTQTQFREGYDEREVDDFLDTAVAAIRHHDSGAAGAPPLTADAVRAQRFTQTKFRRGYDMREVDVLMDRVVEALATREGRPVPPPLPATTGGPTAPAPQSSGAQQTSPWKRFLRALRGDPR